MHIKSTILAAAALSAGVAADFLIITDYPQALQTLNPQQAQSYISSLLPAIRSEFLALATDTSYLARATSVGPELQNFAATATVSIPSVATAIDAFEIYTTVPEWYSQLPSGVRSLYDEVGKSVEDFLKENAPTPVANGTSGIASASASATGNVTVPAITPSGSAPAESTGKAGRVEVGMGMGIAAGLVGLVML